MLVNASSLLTLNPIIVNVELGLYGLLFVLLFAYVHTKFRTAERSLKALQKAWASAESTHMSLVETAQERITKLAAEPIVARPSPITSPTVTADTRSQVAAMGRRGIPMMEIARSCGLPEGEVDVLLGMARLQRAEE